jgi:hypothetical protein
MGDTSGNPSQWVRSIDLFSFFFLKGSVMRFMTKTVAAAVLAGVSLASMAFDTFSNYPSKPPGYTLKQSGSNTRLYQKDGYDLYVQVIDIKGGARAVFNQVGSNNAFTKFNLSDHWSKVPGAFSVVNGQFFDLSKNPTTLSFGVKNNGTILTTGADQQSYPKRVLNITTGVGAYTSVYTPSSLSNTSVSTMIVGLDPSYPKSSTSYIGRTYMCASGRPGTSTLEWLVILSAKNLPQSNALAEINVWDCRSAGPVMMDGSGSTKLRTSNIAMEGWAIGTSFGVGSSDSRAIPQVMAVYNQ